MKDNSPMHLTILLLFAVHFLSLIGIDREPFRACDRDRHLLCELFSHISHVLPFGVLNLSHLLCGTRNIMLQRFSIAKCNSPHLSCLQCTLLHPPHPHPHSQADGHLQAAACHSRRLCVSCTCSGVLLRNGAREPLNMPCICNDATPLKTFCRPGSVVFSYS